MKNLYKYDPYYTESGYQVCIFLIHFYFLQMVEKISDELAASTRLLLQFLLFSLGAWENKTKQPNPPPNKQINKWNQ